MMTFHRSKGGPTRSNLQPFKKHFRVLFPLGCLGLMITPLAVGWISTHVLFSPTSPPSAGELSWKRHFGGGEPSRVGSTISQSAEPQASFILPEVLSVEDAVEWENGWILLDRRLGKVHFVHSTLGLTRSIGGEGPGPGELEDPVALALQDSLLWVLNRRGLFLDRFTLHGEFQERRKIHGGGCLVGLAQELLVLPREGLLLLRVCPATLPGPGIAWVERVTPDGNLSPVLSLPLGELGTRQLHFLRQPAMAMGFQSLFLGTWDTPCIGEFHPAGELQGYRCLPDYPRPRMPTEKKSNLEMRFRRVTELGLLPMSVPDNLPWYDKAFATSAGLVVRRIRGTESRDLVLLPPEGGSSVMASIMPEVTFVGERSILTVQDLLQGSRVEIFRNPWR